MSDSYYNRPEVSNSDLTQLKWMLHPATRPTFADGRNKAFHLGTLVDALVTEPEKANHLTLTIDGEAYTPDEWEWGKEMRKALRREAEKDAFVSMVLRTAETQRVMTAHRRMQYRGFEFELDCRCKWDWWLGAFGGDLKTTAATTQEQFDEAVDFMDWDRSRAYYMDIAGSDRDFIIAISKTNFKIFKKFITRGDELYTRGVEKYTELAFRWWAIN